jgi:putative ABC transport system substrate-binding protein
MMSRRRIICSLGALAGAAVVWPLAASAQQPAVPVVGFLRSTPAAPFGHLVAAFRQGLKETGFVDGENVAIEQRWADNHREQLPGLAADLVRRRVSVIVGNGVAVEAARAATASIPIVFVTSDDPVESGFVASLSRPAGNLTGLTFFGGGQLGAKRMELLHELAPRANVVAVLMDPNSRTSALDLREAEAAARVLNLRIVPVKAAHERDFAPAFAEIARVRAGALLVSGSPVFTSRREALVGLAARHALPAIYDVRDHVAAGGLISYSASFTDAYRQAGVYAGRILNGAKPSDLPVQQPTKFELVVNLKTAKALGITIPQSILFRADEVIE